MARQQEIAASRSTHHPGYRTGQHAGADRPQPEQLIQAPSAMGTGLSRRHGVGTVAAKAAASKLILGQARSGCRSSGWMK